MGDGQHVWAAAEWVMAMRNAFVREEDERLIIASGIPAAWLESGIRCSFGPAPTPWGAVTVTVQPYDEGVRIRWDADWRDGEPPLVVRIDGYPSRAADPGTSEVCFEQPVRARTDGLE